MKLLKLSAIALAVASTSASAAMLVETEQSSLELGGYLQAQTHVNTDTGNTATDSGASRLFLSGTHNLTDDVQAFGIVEYGLNFTNDDSNADDFSQRLGNVGIRSKRFGQLTVGKQYSTFYDVAGYTDTSYQYKDAVTGAFGTIVSDRGGFGRGSDIIQYKKNFAFNENNSLDFGIQTTQQDDKNLGSDTSSLALDNAYGASLVFNTGNLKLGAAYQTVEAEGSMIQSGDDQIAAAVVGAFYNSEKFTIGANYTEGKNNQQDSLGMLNDSNGYEIMAHYRIVPTVKVYGGYNHLDVDSSVNYHVDYATLGLTKGFGDQFRVYLESRIDTGTSRASASYGNEIALGMHYYLSAFPQYK